LKLVEKLLGRIELLGKGLRGFLKGCPRWGLEVREEVFAGEGDEAVHDPSGDYSHDLKGQCVGEPRSIAVSKVRRKNVE
jgi:hypothetical protein